jgi:hypothetical protein
VEEGAPNTMAFDEPARDTIPASENRRVTQ